jgi:glutaminyl-peptide cyclotransferase
VAAAGPVPAFAAVPTYTAIVVQAYPHDPNAFTEGLLYHDGYLYESTGQKGHSSIRKVVLETGAVVQQRNLDARYFGEGIAVWKSSLIELTWQSQIAFVYDLGSFAPRSDFHYSGEGWALTDDSHRLYMSDGTSDIRILSPDTMGESGRIHVSCDGRPIHNVNELEWVKGQIFANVWLTSLIARIDPATGHIVGLIDLTDLVPASVKDQPDDVLNGIAYDAAQDRLFVTGKLWPVLYQITLSPAVAGKDLCHSLP